MPARPASDPFALHDAPTLQVLSEGLRRGDFADLPSDWWLAVADVQGSTQALAQGRYKQVNALGAACIVAACNACGRDDLPFVFGGDGAAVAVPPGLWPRLEQDWAELSRRAQSEFDLHLRVGAVPVAQLRQDGARLALAWKAWPAGFRQACFVGEGLQRAEEALKRQGGQVGVTSSETASTASARPSLSVQGLECRWNDVPNHHGAVVCLLAQPVGENLQGVAEVLQLVESWGPQVRPVTPHKLPVTPRAQHLSVEWALKSPPGWRRTLSAWAVRLKLALLYPVVRRDILHPHTVAGRYAQGVGLNCDHVKFDGVLRAVLDLHPDQERALQALLDRLEAEGALHFGLHRSDFALMTCFVRSLEHHVHFVDGGDGGYARAALQLKAKLAAAARGR